MKINEIWHELENDSSLSSGLLLRRYSAAILPDVYIAFKQPEGTRSIALRIKSGSFINLSRYGNLKDISLAVVPDERDTSKELLLVKLTDAEFKDIFSTLCEDLISGIANVKDEGKLLKELLNRFEKWKSLFERAGLQGLLPEEQRGLYGELYFLRKWLGVSADMQYCVQSWQGPEKELRDFQMGSWAVEVKTTYGNNHQKIHISSERQLDITNLGMLILLHLSVEVQQQHGETLIQIINSITDILNADVSALVQFRSKLLQSGYFNHHAAMYEQKGYHVRQEKYYHVKEDFPRIEEHNVPAGVGNVEYTIILSEYKNYIITETLVFETLK